VLEYGTVQNVEVVAYSQCLSNWI